MKLGEFVSTSLNEILKSVQKVDQEYGGGVISFNTNKDGNFNYGVIDFDIAVMVESDSKTKSGVQGGVGIKVLEVIDIAGVKGDSKSEVANKTSNASRISFSVGINHDFLDKSSQGDAVVSNVEEDIY